MKLKVCVLLSLLLISAIQMVHSTMSGSPIILVPGYGGNQLFAKLQDSNPSKFYCHSSSSDYFLIWVAIEYLGPIVINCFIYRMQLNYNPVTKLTYQPEGVSIKTEGFGDTTTVDYLNPSLQIGATTYFGGLTEILVKENGHVKNISIRGAPYDFRKAPNENKDVIENMMRLVETTYTLNGNKRVILIGHSLGCLYTLHMLHQQSQEWKDKYIKLFVSASGPYAGSVKIMKATASGDNLGIPTVKSLWLKDLSRTWPASQYLLPHINYWNKTDVLAMTDKRNYTAYDYKAFYEDIGYPAAYDIYQQVSKLTDPEKPPGVEVHCVYSTGIPTPLTFDWRGNDFPNSDPKAINGDGDGTVNLRSLDVCLKWRGKQNQPVKSLHIQNVDHFDIIRNQKFYNYVQKLGDSN